MAEGLTNEQIALVNEWKGLPYKAAQRFFGGDADFYDELLAIGQLALCQAAKGYRAGFTGKNFGSFAATKIRWAILDELRRRNRYSQRQMQLLVLASSRWSEILDVWDPESSDEGSILRDEDLDTL